MSKPFQANFNFSLSHHHKEWRNIHELRVSLLSSSKLSILNILIKTSVVTSNCATKSVLSLTREITTYPVLFVHVKLRPFTTIAIKKTEALQLVSWGFPDHTRFVAFIADQIPRWYARLFQAVKQTTSKLSLDAWTLIKYNFLNISSAFYA